MSIDFAALKVCEATLTYAYGMKGKWRETFVILVHM
jgi:hypothetical protein